MQLIRPFGRNRIALHLPASHPALETLKAQALFAASYSKAGAVIAFDLCFPASEVGNLKRLLAENEANLP
mgnify:CR=1 FL=1